MNLAAGDYAVDLVNAANQTSNRFPFRVSSFGPPSVTQVILTNTNDAPVTAKNGIQQVTLVGSKFQALLTVDIFYNDVNIAKLSNSGISQIADVRGDGATIYLNFDFQAKAGAYGVEVACPNGRSTRINFNVPAP